MLTLTSMVTRTLRLYGDHPAIVDREGTFTWAQFCERVARAAAVLKSLGLKPGERFAILCRNGFRNAEIMHAGYWMGAIPVPVNFRLAPPEIAHILDNAECRLLVVENVFGKILAAPELAPWLNGVLMLGGPADAEHPNYDALLAGAEPEPLNDRAEPEDDALLLYTGGTTGRAKGVLLSHLNIVANAMQLGLEMAPRADDVALHVAPMFHSADLLLNPFTLVGGAHLYLAKFTPKAVFKLIETHRVTTTVLTPTMIIALLQDSDLKRYDLSSLRQVIYGSSPMAVEWIKKALNHLSHVEFIQAYGLTETSPILTVLNMAEHEAAIASGDDGLLKSVGRALVGVDMRIVNADGDTIGIGRPGEVKVRGPNVAKGYLKRPEATAEAFHGAWFYTGDIGYLDARGHLFLLDRKKDMIITGGENVYSLEVEAALYQHPGVQECAVVSVPDKVYGEALLAAVVLAPGTTLDDEMLIAHCRGRIGGYKIPRHFVFLDELPKSAMNKVLKPELRRIYGNQGRNT